MFKAIRAADNAFFNRKIQTRLLKSVPPLAPAQLWRSRPRPPPAQPQAHSSRGLSIPERHVSKPKAKPRFSRRKFSNAASAVNSYLSQTLRTPPVSLGDIVEGWDQAKGVVTVITSITQEKPVLVAATATQEADIEIHLQPWKMGREQGDMSSNLTL